MECLLVGYCENSKSFRMWNPVTRKIIISRDVVFREEATYESGSVNEDDYDSLFPLDEVTVVNLKKKKKIFLFSKYCDLMQFILLYRN